jgi:hypothetical protein
VVFPSGALDSALDVCLCPGHSSRTFLLAAPTRGLSELITDAAGSLDEQSRLPAASGYLSPVLGVGVDQAPFRFISLGECVGNGILAALHSAVDGRNDEPRRQREHDDEGDQLDDEGCIWYEEVGDEHQFTFLGWTPVIGI